MRSAKPPSESKSIVLWFRDRQRLKDVIGESPKSLEAMERDGLVVHTHPRKGKYIKTAEYLAHLDARDGLPSTHGKHLPKRGRGLDALLPPPEARA